MTTCSTQHCTAVELSHLGWECNFRSPPSLLVKVMLYTVPQLMEWEGERAWEKLRGRKEMENSVPFN